MRGGPIRERQVEADKDLVRRDELAQFPSLTRLGCRVPSL